MVNVNFVWRRKRNDKNIPIKEDHWKRIIHSIDCFFT
jgi:hypothetical protein